MDTSSEFLRQSSLIFTHSFERIDHAVSQLKDEHIWYRPSAASNSIGIILQHLTGNLNQWVCSAVGVDSYQRNRPAEFIMESHSTKKEILSRFNQLGNRIQEIIKSVPPDSLLNGKRIQGFDENVMSAIYKASTHLELHAGQIVYVAKWILGDRYDELWKPTTTEQGLP